MRSLCVIVGVLVMVVLATAQQSDDNSTVAGFEQTMKDDDGSVHDFVKRLSDELAKEMDVLEADAPTGAQGSVRRKRSLYGDNNGGYGAVDYGTGYGQLYGNDYGYGHGNGYGNDAHGNGYGNDAHGNGYGHGGDYGNGGYGDDAHGNGNGYGHGNGYGNRGGYLNYDKSYTDSPVLTFVKGFKPGKSYVEEGKVVRNYYRHGTYKVALQHYKFIPVVKVVPYTSYKTIGYTGHIQAHQNYKAYICKDCYHGYPKIDVVANKSPYSYMVRRFVYLPENYHIDNYEGGNNHYGGYGSHH